MSFQTPCATIGTWTIKYREEYYTLSVFEFWYRNHSRGNVPLVEQRYLSRFLVQPVLSRSRRRGRFDFRRKPMFRVNFLLFADAAGRIGEIWSMMRYAVGLKYRRNIALVRIVVVLGRSRHTRARIPVWIFSSFPWFHEKSMYRSRTCVSGVWVLLFSLVKSYLPGNIITLRFYLVRGSLFRRVLVGVHTCLKSERGTKIYIPCHCVTRSWQLSIFVFVAQRCLFSRIRANIGNSMERKFGYGVTGNSCGKGTESKLLRDSFGFVFFFNFCFCVREELHETRMCCFVILTCRNSGQIRIYYAEARKFKSWI